MPHPRIVLTSTGTFGDILPLLATAQALRTAGAEVIFGVQADHVPLIQDAGFDAVAILPGLDDTCAALGLSVPEMAERLLNDPDYLFDAILVPFLADGVAALRSAVGQADLVAGTFQTLAGPILAEVLECPFVPLYLQPLVLMSPNDPPVGRGFWFLRRAPGALGRVWNRLVVKAVPLHFARRHKKKVNAARAQAGLGPAKAAPYFGAEPFVTSGVCLYPDWLHPEPPEHALSLTFAGFCFGKTPPSAKKSRTAFDTFLAAGPAPIVFTLGSIAPQIRGSFYETAAAAARALGQRAVLLTGPDWDGQVLGDDIFVAAYLDHHVAFESAAAVVHHGGVGTWAEALRAGHPQLVVPFGADQPDTAARTVRLGVGAAIHAPHLTEQTLAAALQDVLGDGPIKDRAAHYAERLKDTDGASVAARYLLDHVQAAHAGS